MTLVNTDGFDGFSEFDEYCSRPHYSSSRSSVGPTLALGQISVVSQCPLNSLHPLNPLAVSKSHRSWSYLESTLYECVDSNEPIGVSLASDLGVHTNDSALENVSVNP